MGKAQIKEALQLAGNEHKYQKLLILLISMSWVLYNFVLLGSTYIYINPVFHCNQNQEISVLEAQACPMIEDCEMIDKFTLTSELGLYCDLQWTRNLIQSIFPVGAILGLFIMNLVSDTKGRKFSIVISLSIAIFGIFVTLLGGWLKIVYLLIVAQFLQGFGTSSLISLSYALLSDYCSQNIKPRAVIIVNSAWSLSTVLLGVFYLFEISWGVFLLFIILLPLVAVTILIILFIHQSPYILMMQNKREQTLQVLEKVATINGRQQNIDQIRKIITEQQEKDKSNQASIKNMFQILKGWDYLKPLIALSVIRIFASLNFYGISYAFATQGLGLGYNSMIAGFMELIAFIFLTIYVNRIPRRKGIAGFYFIVLIIGLFFFIPVITDNLAATTSLIGASRIFSTVAYTLIASVQTEAFTVQIQSTAVGLIQAFGLIGALNGPLIVDLANNISVDPVALISVLSIFAILPNIFLKQTLRTRLQSEKDPLLQKLNQKKLNDDYHSTQSQSTIITNDEYDQ